MHVTEGANLSVLDADNSSVHFSIRYSTLRVNCHLIFMADTDYSVNEAHSFTIQNMQTMNVEIYVNA